MTESRPMSIAPAASETTPRRHPAEVTAPSLAAGPRPRRRLPSALTLLAAASLALPAAAATELRLATSTVTATGVTPAGCTVLFSVSQERAPWQHRTVTRAQPIIDADGDGEVTYVADPAVADASVWAAVDAYNGAYALGAPADFELVEIAVDWRQMTATNGKLVDDRQDLELAVVRPGTGAWHGRAFDGAAGDRGAAEDGEVQVLLSDLMPIWPAGGRQSYLEQLRPGDVVVGIDPVRLVTWAFVYGSQGSIYGGGR